MTTRDKAHLIEAIGRGLRVGLVLAVTAYAPTAAGKPAERRAARVEVELEPGGFTITQRARVNADVRSDYESAVRMLREARYEPGIALLLKVTERAPDLTAA